VPHWLEPVVPHLELEGSTAGPADRQARA